jgi:Leucine-rich repeat (LRR) protein
MSEQESEEEQIPEFVIQAAITVWRSLENHYRIIDLSQKSLSYNHVNRIINDVAPLVVKKQNCLEFVWLLNLSSNALTGVPKGIQYLTKVERLDLSRNSIVRIDSLCPFEESTIFYNMPLLKVLSLAYNSIQQIPEYHTPPFPDHLRVLDLQNNFIGYLPDKSISNLKHLVRLNLSGNKLKVIPRSIGELTDLVELHLDHNELTYLPQSINRLRYLTTLTLNDNNFDSFKKNMIKENIVVENPLTLEELCKRFITRHSLESEYPSILSMIPDNIIHHEESNSLLSKYKLKSNKKENNSDIICPKCNLTFNEKYKCRVTAKGTLLPAQKQVVPIQWLCCSFDCALAHWRESPN